MGDHSIWTEIANYLSSPEFLSWAGSIGSAVLACCFKKVRTAIASAPSAIAGVFKEKPHVYTNADNETYQIINQELTEIKIHTGAARVAVWQFHNGERFSLSGPAFKVRCTFEALREGVAPDETMANDVLVTKIQDVIGTVMDPKIKCSGATDVTPKGQPRVVRFEYGKMSYGWFKYFMDKNGNDRIYCTLLETHDKRPMGILTIQYINNDVQEGHIEEKMEFVRPSFERIQFALDKTK